jgi:predicted nucleotidyltransferase
MELIKNTIRVGNSAGVLLPKEFLNTQVKIVLPPLNIEKDVLNILSDKKMLPNVLGVYLVGSYARKEQTIESDIDILIITESINDKIEKGKYDLMIVSKDLIDEKMKKNILPLLPMMIEAKPIINKSLLDSYIKTPLTKYNLKWHIDTTKSAMDVVNRYIQIAEKTENRVNDAVSYSLILRLRTIYIIDCLKKRKL